MRKRRVIVVGGGIGGMSLALSLHQAGIGVRIYEAVRDPLPLGVGINLQPTAVRELTELGLGDALAETGLSTRRLNLCNKFGQLIHSEPRGLAAGYHWPQISIHRGRLQLLLIRAVRERIGEENVLTGTRLTDFEQRQGRVRARFTDRESGSDMFDEADVLVGADGIHSAVRRQLYPDDGEPRFAHQVLWRGAVEAEPFLDGHTMIIAGHLHQRVVVYPIGRGADGKLVTNWICQMTVPDHALLVENWNRRVEKERVLAKFGDWRFPWLDVPALVERSKDIYEFPLVDRDPLPAWSFDCVTLLGDAAHPMQPIGSQAGSQAILDASALTRALTEFDDVAVALQRYEAERLAMTTDVTLRNRKLGPEAAMQLVEERAPNGFAHIEDVISQHELDAISRSFAQAAGLDVEKVNQRPSYVALVKGAPVGTE
jgi:5-methylphenazine-1-carboxylate 1-monooxygenase